MEMTLHDIVKELVGSLVRINTTRGKTINGIRYLEEFFHDYGFQTKVNEYKDGEGNLTVTVGPKGTPEFILSGHMDTVPAGDPSKWTQPPFSGQVIDGVMWGRGTVDMKGGIGALVGALLETTQRESDLQQQVTLAISSEEEVGLLGAQQFVEDGLMKNASHLLVGEPTGLDVAVREKGILWMEVEAIGLQAHGSRPDLGHNAIEGLAALLPKIKHVIPPDEVPGLMHTTVNFGTMHGGSAQNVVPERAVVTLDIRTVPGVDNNDVVRAINSLIREESAEVRFISRVTESQPAIENPEPSFTKIVSDSVKEVTESEPGERGMFYGTDAAAFLDGKSVPFVIFGPGSTELLHQTDERVPLKELEVATQVVSKVLSKVCIEGQQ